MMQDRHADRQRNHEHRTDETRINHKGVRRAELSERTLERYVKRYGSQPARHQAENHPSGLLTFYWVRHTHVAVNLRTQRDAREGRKQHNIEQRESPVGVENRIGEEIIGHFMRNPEEDHPTRPARHEPPVRKQVQEERERYRTKQL